MKIRVDHTTHYQYDAPLRYSTQYLRLVPPTTGRQRVIEWRLETPGTQVELRDGYGNVLHLHTMHQAVSEMTLRAVGIVETTAAIDDDQDTIKLSPLLFLRHTSLTTPSPAIIDFTEAYRRRCGTVSGLRQLAGAVLERLPFQAGVTDSTSSAAEAFDAGMAVCQDHAHVFLACCRHLGIPARYVSGYLHDPGFAEVHVATHAWVEAWVVDRWRSFDITNASPAGEDHIRLAIGADYLDVAPVRGTRRGGGSETMASAAIVSVQQ